MLKGYKYRIYPTNSQKIMIEKSFDVCRMVYNLALETKIYAYKSHGKNLSAFDLCYQLVGLKKDYAWINDVDSQALQMSIKNMDNAFKNFFSGNGFPKFKKKNDRQSFGSCLIGVNQKVDFDKKTISIPKIKNIKTSISRRFNGKIKSIKINKTKSGKYFASILVDELFSLPIKPIIKENTSIGIDLGVKYFVVTSDGRFFEPNRFLKKSIEKLKYLQKNISRKIKGSNNRKKAVFRVSKLHEKITNQRLDYIHKLTTSLICDNQTDTFVMENLNISGMLKNRKLSQAISDVGFGEFISQMKYKSNWYGKNFIQIGRFQPSSKMCSVCELINEKLSLKDRKWVCSKCNTLHDRDLNAAKNICKMGLKNKSGTGSSNEPVELQKII